MCRARRVQQGETTKRATARQAEQRSWARWERCNRAHSAVTQEAKASEAQNLSVHAVCEMLTSGQLLFFRLMCVFEQSSYPPPVNPSATTRAAPSARCCTRPWPSLTRPGLRWPAHARCDDCGHDFLVAFFCKGWGVGPSCTTRRIAETAAHSLSVQMPPAKASWRVAKAGSMAQAFMASGF